MAAPGDSPRRMTDLNGWMRELGLGRVEGIDWPGPNKFQEDGVVVYPPDFSPDRKYPLVLVIHGGADLQPEEASRSFVCSHCACARRCHLPRIHFCNEFRNR
jgi:dipeptidyl aminopeptidase/acylaminoacyl peptidase